MTDLWKVGYRRAVTGYIARNGSPLDPNPSYYGGWYHKNSGGAQAHIASCGLADGLTFVEDSWDEFHGTFYEGDTMHHGMRMDVTCQCGQVREMPWRLEATMSDITLGVLNQPDED